MPPPGMPHPDTATYESLARYLESALDQAAAATPNPGRPAAYRLSRFQYANAVRDLIALTLTPRRCCQRTIRGTVSTISVMF